MVNPRQCHCLSFCLEIFSKIGDLEDHFFRPYIFSVALNFRETSKLVQSMRPAQSVILMKSQHYWSEQHRQGFLGSGARLRGSAGCGVRSGQEGSVLPTAGKLESGGGRTSCYPPPSGHLEPASTACGLHHPLCANPGSAGVRRVRP